MNIFKKIKAVFTKFEKIADILIKVQRGLVVCKTCLETIRDSLKPASKTYKTIEGVLKYVDTGAEAIETILDWIGHKDDICAAQPRGLADEELARITAEVRECISK